VALCVAGALLVLWLPEWLASRPTGRPLRWSRLGAPVLAVFPAERAHALREALTTPAASRPRRALDTTPNAPAVKPARRPAETPRNGTSAAHDEVAVTIVPFPPAVEVTIDGKPAGKGPRLDLKLAPGRHEVTLTHPSCPVCLPTSYPIEVDAKRAKNFRLAIRYEPVHLTVQGPKGAKILVDGVLRGATNEELRIPVRGLGAQALDVVVRWGDAEERRRVTARAGEKVSIDVP